MLIVLFMTREAFFQGSLTPLPVTFDNHVIDGHPLYFQKAAEFPDGTGLDDVFRDTQNLEGSWCNPPKRSMSVGDVIWDTIANKFIRCEMAGWKEVDSDLIPDSLKEKAQNEPQ